MSLPSLALSAIGLAVACSWSALASADTISGVGSNNVYGAGSVDPGVATNSNNSIYGVGAGSNMTGTNNSAFGVAAGVNVNGGYNTSIGQNAGTNVQGNNNAFMGNDSGYNVTGDANVGAGINTIRNVTGTGNTGSGANSAQDIQGDFNSGLGNNSNRNVTGSYNTSSGTFSGWDIKGSNNTANGANAGRNVTGDNNTAVGTYAGQNVSGSNNVAIGNNAGANINASNAVAVGNNAAATANNALAIGSNAQASNANDVALGANSRTAAANPTPSGVVNGVTYNYAGAAPSSVVSVGSAGNERQISNVAAGRVSGTSTDAVNGSQLNATNQAVQRVSDKVDNVGAGTAAALGGGASYNAQTGAVNRPNYTVYGNTVNNVGDAIDRLQKSGPVQYSDPSGRTTTTNAGNDVTLVGGDGGRPVTIHNVAAGAQGTDAVNVDQLNAANFNNQQQFKQLRSDLSDTRRDAFGAAAGAMAMAGLPQAFLPGKNMLAVATATTGGESAIAVGLSSLSDNGRWVVKFSGSTNTRGQGGASLGAGFQW
ncbi:YadA family autotransporter adhesin [Chromobacterium haemolyticum]|uniref:YadA family autotransporter adhesin n=1 Tax=Chromobacterium haemolyticum TaxID=394935 RepID=UPI002448B42A|nr:YadA family autotransporter adhesin [Chromobacterium haemolyticum]MDH0341542.1 YadA family autotransporter adhesin [Chromobacterium haemolyticum]